MLQVKAYLLHKDWRAQLADWLPHTGVRITLVLPDQVLADDELRDNFGSKLDSASWWDGHTLHLAYDPPFGPIEWFYMLAHAGLAEAKRRKRVDFGLLDLNPDTMARVESRARNLVMGWAYRAGASPDNVWRVAMHWQLTKVAMMVSSKDMQDCVIQAHLRQVDATMRAFGQEIAAWGAPVPPQLWEMTTLY